MKQIVTIIMVFLCGVSYSQIYTPVTPTQYGSNFLRVKPFDVLHIPSTIDTSLRTSDNSPQIRVAYSKIWWWNGAFWTEVGSGSALPTGTNYQILRNYSGSWLAVEDTTYTDGKVFVTGTDLLMYAGGWRTAFRNDSSLMPKWYIDSMISAISIAITGNNRNLLFKFNGTPQGNDSLTFTAANLNITGGIVATSNRAAGNNENSFIFNVDNTNSNRGFIIQGAIGNGNMSAGPEFLLQNSLTPGAFPLIGSRVADIKFGDWSNTVARIRTTMTQTHDNTNGRGTDIRFLITPTRTFSYDTEVMRLDGNGSMRMGGLTGSVNDTANGSAIMQLDSDRKGLLIPRMSAAQRIAIASPSNGLKVYDTDSSRLMIYSSSSWKGVAYTSDASGSGISEAYADGRYLRLFPSSSSQVISKSGATGGTWTFGEYSTFVTRNLADGYEIGLYPKDGKITYLYGLDGYGTSLNFGYPEGFRNINFPDASGTVQLSSDNIAFARLTGVPSFLTTESDPVYSASPAFGISGTDITNWNGKQSALVSGTNIKTVNGASVLGSGDLSVPSIPVGGTAGQALVKNSSTNFDVSWATPSGAEGISVKYTEGGSDILTSSSERMQHYLGTMTQDITLPNATTLSNGTSFKISNESISALTCFYNGGGLADVVLQSSKYTFTLINNSTSKGEWYVTYEYMPSGFRKQEYIIGASGSTAAPTSLGNSVQTATTMSSTTVGNTNHWIATLRKRFTTSTTAGTATGLRSGAVQFFSSNVAGIGGFRAVFNVGQNVNLNGGQYFFGIGVGVAALAGDPSALVNIVGIGYDAGDASTGNYFLMHNDGSGTATKIDLGATYASRAVDKGMQLQILVAPNSSTWYIKITSLVDGSLVYTGTLTTNVPAVNTALGVHAQARNGAVASATGVDVSEIRVQPF